MPLPAGVHHHEEPEFMHGRWVCSCTSIVAFRNSFLQSAASPGGAVEVEGVGLTVSAAAAHKRSSAAACHRHYVSLKLQV